MERKYLGEGISAPSEAYLGFDGRMHRKDYTAPVTFRLSSFLSSGVLDPDSDQGSVNLRIYLLSKPQYINPDPKPGIDD